MMRLSRQTALLFVATIALCVPLSAQRSLPALQAELVTTYRLADGREVVVPGHYYRNSAGLVREGDPAAALITNIAEGTVTVLSLKEKEARVYKVALPRDKAGIGAPSQAPTRESHQQAPASGFESSDGMFEGMSVTKTRRAVGQDDSEEVWVAKELGLVVFRQFRKAGTVTTRRAQNVAVKEPLTSLFEIPHDFKVVHEERPERLPVTPPVFQPPRRLPAEFPR